MPERERSKPPSKRIRLTLRALCAVAREEPNCAQLCACVWLPRLAYGDKPEIEAPVKRLSYVLRFLPAMQQERQDSDYKAAA